MTQNGLLVDLDGIMEREGIGPAALNLSEPFLEVQDAINDAEEGSEEAAMLHMLLSIMTGQASADEFRGLVSLMEEAVTDVQVRETEPGLHVLTASGFDTEGDAEADAMIGDMELQIAYKEGLGLAWARIDHLGEHDGTIRFDMTDVTLDSPIFDREQWSNNNTAMRVNLSQLLDMSEAFKDK